MYIREIYIYAYKNTIGACPSGGPNHSHQTWSSRVSVVSTSEEVSHVGEAGHLHRACPWMQGDGGE